MVSVPSSCISDLTDLFLDRHTLKNMQNSSMNHIGWDNTVYTLLRLPNPI